METYYIYTLEHPETCEVRYIGYSKEPKRRYASHLCVGKQKNHKDSWIKSLKEQGLKPVMTIIDTASTIEEVHNLEVFWIAQCKEWGFRLTNLTLGGEGCEGYQWSEEQKQQISESLKAKYAEQDHALKGRKWSEERKKKHSKLMMGKKGTYGMLGKIHPARKQVKCYKDAVLVETFSSCKEAADKLGLNAGNISNVCSGRNKSAGGYTFKYIENEKE